MANHNCGKTLHSESIFFPHIVPVTEHHVGIRVRVSGVSFLPLFKMFKIFKFFTDQAILSRLFYSP